MRVCELDAKLRLDEFQKKYEDEIDLLDEELKEKKVEIKRLTDSFKIIKTSNDSLKKRLLDKDDKYKKLEIKYNSLNNRLVNLQVIQN
jgi:predicted nuclease with TOPRIM domain